MGHAKSKKYEYLKARNCYRKRIKDLNGNYHAIYAKTVKEMDEKVRAFRLEIQEVLAAEARMRKKPIRPSKNNPLFDTYAQEWLDLYCGPLAYGTQVDYQTVCKNHVIPPLSGMRIQEIRQRDINRAMVQVCGNSESVYDKTYMLIKQIFRSAIADGIITSNPCPPARKGGIPPKPKQALTKEQISALLCAIKGTNTHLFCMIGLYSGLRREEILGLQWDCVSLEDVPCIDVKRALRFEHNRPVVSEQLKTAAARRVIPIPPQLAECLKEAKTLSQSKYVIANQDGGPCSGSQFRKLWNIIRVYTGEDKPLPTSVVSEATKHSRQPTGNVSFEAIRGLSITPHILRHTYISNLLLGGVDIKTVQYLAGHERATITLDIYAHLTYNRPEEILPKVNLAFSNE